MIHVPSGFQHAGFLTKANNAEIVRVSKKLCNGFLLVLRKLRLQFVGLSDLDFFSCFWLGT